MSAPYPEGAIVNLAVYASRSGRLEGFYSPSRRWLRLTAQALEAVHLAPKVAARLRRGATLVPELREVCPSFEFRRLILARAGIAFSMDAAKVIFDRRVAQSFHSRTSYVLGMPGACQVTFERYPDQLRVFHQVDGHPAARNLALRRHYGLAAQEEMVPDGVRGRIERELELADVVMTPSSTVTSDHVAYGVAAEKILQIPFGVDCKAFRPFESQRLPSIERPQLLFIGQISYRKGIPFLLDAVRGARVNLTLVGPVVNGALLRNLPDNVQHLETVPHDSLSMIMARSDAVILPSVKDNFGLVIPESLAAGLPVIVTENVGSKDLLLEHDGLVVATGDVVALREAITHVRKLSSEDRRDRAERFRNRCAAGEVNDWELYGQRVLEGLDDAAGRK